MTLDRIVGRAYGKLPDGFRNGVKPLTSLSQYLSSLLPHDLRHEVLRQTTAGGDDPAKVASLCAGYSTASTAVNAAVGIGCLIAGSFLPTPLNFGMLGFGFYASVDTIYRSWPLRNGTNPENLRGTLALDIPYRIANGKMALLDLLSGPYQLFRQKTPFGSGIMGGKHY